MVSLACNPPCCSLSSLFFAAGVVVSRHHCPSLSSTVWALLLFALLLLSLGHGLVVSPCLLLLSVFAVR